MRSNYIALAVPFFFLLIGIELLVARSRKRAVYRVGDALGDVGCAAKVAQEFGEHPETAVTRMRWARAEVAGVFGGLDPDPGYAPRHARPSGVCPAPRLPGDLTSRSQGRHMLQAC